MAPSGSAVPGPLYFIDPSERASGSQPIGGLERRGRGNGVYPVKRDPGPTRGRVFIIINIIIEPHVSLSIRK